MSRRSRLCCLLACAALAGPSGGAELRLFNLEEGQPVAVRVHLRDSAGTPVKVRSYPSWNDHFVCDGLAKLELVAGSYSFVVERGPEYYAVTGNVTLVEAQSISLTNRLRRLANLAQEGWWSGETHVHRPLQDMELLMRAEDLHLAEVTTWWNDVNPWTRQPLPAKPVVSFDRNRFYGVLAGEDERGGGALLYFGLKQPLSIAGSTREYPSPLKFLREAKRGPGVGGGAWVEIEKPFWWDAPVWLASGLVDSVGIAHNHLHRDGVMDNEAWGRPRDRAKYPSAWGNGLWTQDIYSHILNCGIRLPPSAGSASGVLPNPVGNNRAYVQVDGDVTYEKWWAGLRAGRVFVGNGPLLRAQANGQFPGHVFKSKGPLRVELRAQLDSREPIAFVELLRNGRAERLTLPASLAIQESGWFLLRAVADVTNTFRFAATGPWYVEIGEQVSPVRRESAQFFLDWVQARKGHLTQVLSDLAQRREVLQPVLEAERYWAAQAAGAGSTSLTGEVVDAATGQIIPSRIYIQRDDGRWFFAATDSPGGSALRYERRNWSNTNAVEYHTTLSGHAFRAELPPARYTVTVERGKEYLPLVQQIELGAKPMKVRLPLRRWVNMAARGWYSGDTHVHRTAAELPNVMLAEDLNVAFPLSYWVTKAFAPPTQGDKNTDAGAGAELVSVDPTHVFWPRNTEYEIFTVSNRSHTLGAVFALGHKTPFTQGGPPVGGIARQAHGEGALLDLDKHDWPWSMALVPVMGVDLYELANNHHWRTEFGITNWSTAAPEWMALGSGSKGGGEGHWTLFTFQNYYALLDCGFRLRPTAGTANGVHPVPLGFGRVYVRQPEGFSYSTWLKGLNEGRSFVTTGPMLLADVVANEISGTVLSEAPVDQAEVIINGELQHRLVLTPEKNAEGAWEARFRQPLRLEGTSWVAVRCFERRAGGRLRFAHTAPVWFDVPGHPLRPRKEEVNYLLGRVQDQLTRSAGALPPAALAEYREALETYERVGRTLTEFRRPADDADKRFWLENMAVFHRFAPEEISAAAGLASDETAAALRGFDLVGKTAPRRRPGEPLRVLPYPGGRHPRLGFFDGAIMPQRETKVSVFTPWDEESYVVVDVPEAIFSNLGLTYLAHTHIPTIWDQRGVTLPRLEWQRGSGGVLTSERVLPNGIAFGARVAPTVTGVRMELWLRNGTTDKLTGLRVQNCVMLGYARGFNAQTSTNKLFQPPYAAVRSADGRRWVITGWDPVQRCWGNEQCPCLHSDPQFPDCPAGETVRVRGWLSFYEGTDVQAEFRRIEAAGWRN
jgi:hypothetical protein